MNTETLKQASEVCVLSPRQLLKKIEDKIGGTTAEKSGTDREFDAFNARKRHEQAKLKTVAEVLKRLPSQDIELNVGEFKKALRNIRADLFDKKNSSDDVDAIFENVYEFIAEIFSNTIAEFCRDDVRRQIFSNLTPRGRIAMSILADVEEPSIKKVTDVVRPYLMKILSV